MKDIDLTGCSELTNATLSFLNRPSLPLQRLAVGNANQILDGFDICERLNIYPSASVDATTGIFGRMTLEVEFNESISLESLLKD
jgi:hypothetical protein